MWTLLHGFVMFVACSLMPILFLAWFSTMVRALEWAFGPVAAWVQWPLFLAWLALVSYWLGARTTVSVKD